MSIRARPRPVMCSAVSLKGDPKFCGRKMLRFERRALSILENIWYSPLKYEFEDRAFWRFARQRAHRYPHPTPLAPPAARTEQSDLNPHVPPAPQNLNAKLTPL